MARNGTSLEAAHASVKQLIAEKLKYLVPMTIIFMVGYIGLTILAGFAKDLMGTKVIGSVNLGFVLIAFNYLLSWVLAIVYGRIAADKFDPLAATGRDGNLRSGETEMSLTLGIFIVILLITLGITYWAAKRTSTTAISTPPTASSPPRRTALRWPATGAAPRRFSDLPD